MQNCVYIELAYRYAYPWWKEKVIDSDMKRREGLCPLTPEETTLTLMALGIDRNIQIYIAAGEIYGAKRRMESLTSSFPNVVSTTWAFTGLMTNCQQKAGSCDIFSCFLTGQKGDASSTFRLDVFPEPLISDGCIGLYGLIK